MAKRAGFFCRLRGRRCAVAARRGAHDLARRCNFRFRQRSGAGLVCVGHRCHTRLFVISIFVARLGAGEIWRTSQADQRRCRQRWPVLSVRAAPGAAVPVLRREPGDGADLDQDLAVLLGQPTGHVGRHSGVCECGHPACTNQFAQRHHFSGNFGFVRASGYLPDHREKNSRCVQGPQGVRTLCQRQAEVV